MSEQRLVYRVDEVAQLLDCGRSTVFDAVRRNELPSIRLGRRILIPKAALHELLELNGTGDGPRK